MCYDAQYLTKRAEKYAERYGIPLPEIKSVQEQIGQVFHTSGFQHRDVPVIVNYPENEFTAFNWGLIPHWATKQKQAESIRNKTLNARAETVFEKNSFKKAVKSNRCLLVLDGFFEHHHLEKETYPYHISLKSGEPFSVAAIYERSSFEMESGETRQVNTLAILTLEGNDVMKEIHNNPKMSGPRMPLILPKELEQEWLKPRAEDEIELVKDLMKPFPSEELKYHTVRKLRGKLAVGNKAEAIEKKEYPVIGLP